MISIKVNLKFNLIFVFIFVFIFHFCLTMRGGKRDERDEHGHTADDYAAAMRKGYKQRVSGLSKEQKESVNIYERYQSRSQIRS